MTLRERLRQIQERTRLCWLLGHVYEAKGFTGVGVKCSRCGWERRIPGAKPIDVPEILRRALEEKGEKDEQQSHQ